MWKCERCGASTPSTCQCAAHQPTDRHDAIRQRLKAQVEVGGVEAYDDFLGNCAADIAYLLAEIDTLHQQLTTAEQERDEVLAARQRVRDSFNRRDGDGNCQCVYCVRDVEGLSEHAADYELRWLRATQERDAALQRAHLAEQALARTEAERDKARAEIAELHDIVSGFDAITDPTEHPDLNQRAFLALGDGADHTICRMLEAAEARIVDLEAERDTLRARLEPHV